MKPLILFCWLALCGWSLAEPATPITAAEYSPDGKLLAMGQYGRVVLQDVETAEVVRVLPGHPGKVNAVHFSPDGTQLLAATGVTGARGSAILWDVNTGKPVGEFGEHRDILYDAQFSPDGKRIATAGYDRRIRIWDRESGKVEHLIEVHNGAIFDLAFSPDGTVLASASADETIKLWQVATGKRLDTLNQPEAEQFTVSFTPDGRFILAGGADNRIRMWRWVSKDRPRINPLVHARFAHEGSVVRLAVSSDGAQLVSAAEDHSLKLWKLPELELVRDYETQPEMASVLAMDPGKSAVLAARLDGSWKRYPLRAQETTEDTADWVKPKAVAMNSEELRQTQEAAEPNDTVDKAQVVEVPAEIKGVIGMEGDVDLYKFAARKGEEWVVEVHAARSKSPLDSKIEILDEAGDPVEWALLQALRDSWINFRGVDSNVSDGLRLQNWEEMELNEYYYFNGEVVKFWLYPRGPDSGFKLYPGFGKRYTYFGTPALSHPLGEPGYVVRALPPGSTPKPNGLPTFRMVYENDDHPQRRWERDSYLRFAAPKNGNYSVRIQDVRGFGGPDHHYTLRIRPSQPDFEIKVEGKDPKVNAGSGREFVLKVQRLDGFEGQIQVDVENLPPGFHSSGPVIIQAGQHMAQGVIFADADAPKLDPKAAKATKLIATATIRGESVRKQIGSLGTIELLGPPKYYVEIYPTEGTAEPGKPVEFVAAPGETVTGRVVIRRNGHNARVQMGKEDAGRNFPHGVYVDNIGLNGLLIPERETERTFFITVAPWVPEGTRTIHLRGAENGGQCSLPAILHVRGK